MVGVFRAVEELAAALEAGGAIIARLQALHYKPPSSVLANIIPPAVGSIGSPDDACAYATPAWYFRRALEQLGLL